MHIEKRNSLGRILLAVCFGFGLAAPAVAQAGAKPDPRLATYKANDKNKDGKLAKEEFAVVARSYGFGGQVDAVWSQADKNKDAFLQEAEFLAALDAGSKMTTQVATSQAPVMVSANNLPANAPPAIQVLVNFKTYDKNSDTKLAKDEYQTLTKALNLTAQADATWTSVNKDKDTFITEAELIAALSGMQGVRVSGAPQAGGQTPVAGATPTDEQRMAAFKASDKNKDGKLTKTEYIEVLKVLGYSDQLESYWAQRDVNKDGFITEAEYKPAIGGAIAIAPQ